MPKSRMNISIKATIIRNLAYLEYVSQNEPFFIYSWIIAPRLPLMNLSAVAKPQFVLSCLVP